MALTFRVFFFSWLACLTGTAEAFASVSPAVVFEAVVGPGATPACRERLHRLKDYRLLFSLLPFREFLGREKSSLELSSALANWSNDLLLKIILQVEQEFLPQCPTAPKVVLSMLELKRQFLQKVGCLHASNWEPEDVDFLFRGLLSQKSDAVEIRKKIEAASAETQSNSRALLKQVLGGEISSIRKVVVAAPTGASIRSMEAAVAEVCSDAESCSFWDSRIVYRAMIVEQKGIAVFLPELGLLVVATELLTDRNVLNKIVLFHELGHVAEKYAEIFLGKHWKEEFSEFSGWKREKGKWTAQVTKSRLSRKDELTVLSKGSSFSLFPDSVYLGKKVNDKTFDGFVFGKAYEESMARNDLSEDFADHLAAFRYFPERFCFQGKPIAPKKFRWLTEHIFREAPPLSCAP